MQNTKPHRQSHLLHHGTPHFGPHSSRLIMEADVEGPQVALRFGHRTLCKQASNPETFKGPADIFKLLLDYKDRNTGESMEFKELSVEAVVLVITGKQFCLRGH